MIDIEKEQEVWKIYPDYPFIEVSNLGRVRTKDRVVTSKNGRKLHYKGRILKQHLNKSGYMYVGVHVNGKQISLRVHRMVAICFVPNPNNYPQVNHIDCDPNNNRWDNLEWCTGSYNCQYREKCGKALGKRVFAVNLETFEVFQFSSLSEACRQLEISLGGISDVLKGEYLQDNGYWFTEDESEITEEKIREIKAKMLSSVIAIDLNDFKVLWFKSQSEATRQLGVRQGDISNVVRGKYNKTHGYFFCNADENAVDKIREKFGDELANKVRELMNENKKLEKRKFKVANAI